MRRACVRRVRAIALAVGLLGLGLTALSFALDASREPPTGAVTAAPSFPGGFIEPTDSVKKVGPLFSDDRFSWSSGEGWYFSAKQPHILYVSYGPVLYRYDVIAHRFETVFDISTRPDVFGKERDIWQTHSSDDDRVHSATLREQSTRRSLGCFVYREDRHQFSA